MSTIEEKENKLVEYFDGAVLLPIMVTAFMVVYMIEKIKEFANAVMMYVYLIYYTERLRRDQKFMIKEALRINRENTLAKRAQYEKEMNWR